MRAIATALILCAGLFGGLTTPATDLDEFKVKRQEVFEFTQKPAVTRDGDRITIAFASKGFCDVTVAIETADGKIVRHLAAGVLGPNAPEPFQKNSLKQTLVWDGKNDQGEYVDDKDNVTVRVSLGLKPQFEKTLFWSPKKRTGYFYPTVRAAPEGVYVAESYEVSQVRLFDHQGEYVRTVYPFPADQVDKVRGLKMHTFAQDGATLPLKRGFTQATLLTCGGEEYGNLGIFNMAAADGRIALVSRTLNRLAPDGTSGGLPLEGPKIGLPSVKMDVFGHGIMTRTYSPFSVALSPDAKWLYLSGCYLQQGGWCSGYEWMNAVLRMPYEENKESTLFVGDLKLGLKNGGAEAGKFRMASCVACDAKGRVYVGDYMNDRVQVFDADGKHLKSIPTPKPAHVAVHQKTGDIYVFSWMLNNILILGAKIKVEPTMTHLGPLENPGVKFTCPLPLVGHEPTTTQYNTDGGLQHRVELDSWADKPAVWIMNGKVVGDGIGNQIRIYEEADGKLKLKRDFAVEIQKSIQRLVPPILWRQRLVVNPATGKLYVLEGDSGVMKSVNQLVEISPDTGKVRLVELPLGAEDLCIDLNGVVYVRTDTLVARYDPTTWREVPWDYGEEKKGHSFGMGARGADLVSALLTPGHRSFNFWHLGGIDISAKGHLVVTTCNGEAPKDLRAKGTREAMGSQYQPSKYTPQVYPGRMRWGEIHIFDKHGKVIFTDAVPGMGHLNGIGIDQDDNLYMLAASRRIINGKPTDPGLDRDASGAVLKVAAGKAKVLSTGGASGIPIPLPPESQPKRSADLSGATSGWVEGAEWFYGGVGFSTPGGCVCWNSRFDLDDFNRSFAPETLHYSVAVLDSNGNLILRIGKYGNVDDGKPLIASGGPANPRSIGGDEVALFYACYVATHTDRRLFIADAGNARILSVKLGYHVEEKIPLKDVPASGTKN